MSKLIQFWYNIVYSFENFARLILQLKSKLFKLFPIIEFMLESQS